MSRVFVDTSAWFEVGARASKDHPAFKSWYEQEKGRVTTSTDVWNETIALIKSRVGHEAAVGMGEHMRNRDYVHMVDVEPTIREEAWDLLKRRGDKGYSLTDCTSFIIMEGMSIHRVATKDNHFAQEGFELVPG